MHFPSHYKNPAKKDQILQVRRRPAGHVDTTLRTLTPSPTSESSLDPTIIGGSPSQKGLFQRLWGLLTFSVSEKTFCLRLWSLLHCFPIHISVCEYAMNMVMRNTNESKLGCHDVIMLKLKSVTFWLSVTDWLRLARYWVVFALEMKIILVNFEFQKVCGD